MRRHPFDIHNPIFELKGNDYGIPCPVCCDFVAKNQRGLRQHMTIAKLGNNRNIHEK